MSRSTEGWIKVNRKIEKNWIGKDVVAYALWVRLVMWANYTTSKYRQGGVMKVIERGQILTSYSELARSFSIDRSTVTKILTCFQNDGMINSTFNSKGMTITICNYEKYQCLDNEASTALSTGEPTAESTAHPAAESTAESTHIKKENNNKKEKKKKKNLTLPSNGEVSERPVALALVSDINPQLIEIATSWLEFALKEAPWQGGGQSWTVEGFAKEIERVCQAVELNMLGAAELLKFIKGDDFWRRNAISPFGLLKKSSKNDLRKIDNVLLRMRTKQDRVDRAIQEFVEDDTFVAPF